MKNEDSMCLCAIPIGISCEVKHIGADKQTERRLLDLGVRVGSIIRVLNRQINGSLVVAKGESRLAVDSLLAENVLVSVA